MNNLFILSCTGVQYATPDLDPIADYRERLKHIDFKFLSTLPKDRWNDARTFMKNNSNGTFQDDRGIELEELGLNMQFDTAGLKVPFAACFDMLMPHVKSEKTFTVVTSNYAHSLSAILSRAAFNAHGSDLNKTKIVINIDYHADFGTMDSSSVLAGKVDNGAWGAHHVSSNWFIGSKGVKLIYTCLGCNHGDSQVFYRIFDNHKKAGSEKQFSKNISKTVVENLVSVVDGGSDVYITIDRDVLTNGRTHFRVNGSLNRSTVREQIESVITQIKSKGLNVCGCDVTGLPHYEQRGGDPDAVSNAVEDIKEWHRYLTGMF